MEKYLTCFNKIIERLEKQRSEIDSLSEELREKYDNLSDYIQKSDYGQNFENIIVSLDYATFDGLDTAIDELRYVASCFETLPRLVRGEGVEVDVKIDNP